jgi:hypothetical protein
LSGEEDVQRNKNLADRIDAIVVPLLVVTILFIAHQLHSTFLNSSDF